MNCGTIHCSCDKQMKLVFVDTSGIVAAMNAQDQHGWELTLPSHLIGIFSNTDLRLYRENHGECP
jgi:hypothetical protein